MTRTEIIELAKQADIQDAWFRTPHPGVVAQLERFAQLVAASERESCAQVCEIWADDHCKATSECDYSNCDMTAVALDLGKAIRSRT